MIQYRTVELADGRWRLERWEPRRRNWVFVGHHGTRHEAIRWLKKEAARPEVLRLSP